jgi:predicted nuclease with TOPRIM domain
MRLTSEREKEIREFYTNKNDPYDYNDSVVELFQEIDRLRQENHKQRLELTDCYEQIVILEVENKELKEGIVTRYKEVTSVRELHGKEIVKNIELREVLVNLLQVSRECANDYELGDEGYYFWVEQAKELLNESK